MLDLFVKQLNAVQEILYHSKGRIFLSLIFRHQDELKDIGARNKAHNLFYLRPDPYLLSYLIYVTYEVACC